MRTNARWVKLAVLLVAALLFAACSGGTGGDAGRAEAERLAEAFMSCLVFLGNHSLIQCPSIEDVFSANVVVDGTSKSRDDLVNDWNSWKNDPDDIRTPGFQREVEHHFTGTSASSGGTVTVQGTFDVDITRNNVEKFKVSGAKIEIRLANEAGAWRISSMHLSGLWKRWEDQS